MIGEFIAKAWVKLAGEKNVNQAAIDRIASQLTDEGYVLEKFEQRTTA